MYLYVHECLISINIGRYLFYNRIIKSKYEGNVICIEDKTLVL